MPPSTSGSATSFPIRCLRLARLAAHLLAGLFTLTFRFARLSEAGQRTQIRRWSRKLLAILSVKVQAAAQPRSLPPRCMLVANHISWMDMFVVMATHPASFIAKSEIRGWPLIGALCAGAGTLFIERGNRSALRRVNAVMAACIEQGRAVSIYPEGTTDDGLHLGRFHAGLFQPAVDTGATLLPMALRYTDRDGRHCDATDFLGDMTLLASLWQVTSASHIVAVLTWLPAIDCAGRERRELARETEAAIAAALGLPPRDRPIPAPRSPRNAPGTAGGLPGESR